MSSAPPVIRLFAMASSALLLGFAPLARAIQINPGSTASAVAAEGGNALAQCTPTTSPLVACTVEVRTAQNALGLSAESSGAASSNGSAVLFTEFTVPASASGESVLLAGSLSVTVSSTGDLSAGNSTASATAGVRIRVVDPASGSVVADRQVVDARAANQDLAIDRDDAVTLPLVLLRGVVYRFELEGAVATASTASGPASRSDFASAGRSIGWTGLTIAVGPDPFDRIASLDARVDQLEDLTATHTSQIAALQTENAVQQGQINALIAENQAQQQQIDKLRHDLDTHTHVYLTGRGEGHNNTEATTATALIPSGGPSTGSTTGGGTGTSASPPPSGPARVTSLTISSAVATVGQAVTAAAAANNGSHVQYKWLLGEGSRWTVLSDYSAASSYAFTPTKPGSYRIGVWVRNAGSTAAYEHSSVVGFRGQP